MCRWYVIHDSGCTDDSNNSRKRAWLKPVWIITSHTWKWFKHGRADSPFGYCKYSSLDIIKRLSPYVMEMIILWIACVVCSYPLFSEARNGKEIEFFHTQLWFPISNRDFRRFESDFRCFVNISQDILKHCESIMGARAVRSSLSWACIPQKSLAIAHDFWNTNSRGWTPFRTVAHDGFSIYSLNILL